MSAFSSINPDASRPLPTPIGLGGNGSEVNGSSQSQSQSQTTKKFTLFQPARPMLSREADSVFWMSRYVERAEHVARLLLVNTNVLMDVGDLAPALQEKQWRSILTIMYGGDLPRSDASIGQRVAQHMAFNIDNSNSLINCISRARENARSVRESISAEMWEELNTLYWQLQSDDLRARFDEAPEDFYRSIMNGSMLFQGLTDQTLPHGQRWHFSQLGKYIERALVTCRIIEHKFEILRGAESMLETPLRNINWMAVLRSCCSIEAYRRTYMGDMDPLRVAGFLILQANFPRSIRHSVGEAYHCIREIRQSVNPNVADPAERILGRLDAQLEYAEMNEVLAEGIPAYLQRIQMSVTEAAMAVQKAYFLQ